MPLRRPMTEEVTLWMDAPPSAVWDLVSDVTRIGEFSPETFEARWRSGSSGPEVGARFAGHVRREGVGLTYWSACEVTVCEPERHFEFSVGTGKGLTLNNWGYRLEPNNGGTLVHEYFRIEPNLGTRLYWALAGRSRGRTNRRGMQQTLLRMKDVVESTSGSGNPT